LLAGKKIWKEKGRKEQGYEIKDRRRSISRGKGRGEWPRQIEIVREGAKDHLLVELKRIEQETRRAKGVNDREKNS